MIIILVYYSVINKYGRLIFNPRLDLILLFGFLIQMNEIEILLDLNRQVHHKIIFPKIIILIIDIYKIYINRYLNNNYLHLKVLI